MCAVKVVKIGKCPFDVYIGRAGFGREASKFANPYKIGIHGGRQQVIEKYSSYLWRQVQNGAITLNDLRELDGKTLGCFCKPKPCHGDVIVKAVAWALTCD